MVSRIEAFGLSDAGCVRDVNEDNFLCLDLSAVPAGGVPGSFLIAVADGIGGHAAGSVASGMAVQVLREEFRNDNGAEPRVRLDEVFHKANRVIFERAAREPACAGMGTTLTAAVGKGEKVAIANVGDSRAYLFRDGDLRQLTEDHSWAWEQRRRCLLSEQEIRRSPFRSMITRSLGYVDEVQVDVFDIVPETGDLLLFCTDGLHGIVPEKRIVKILHKQAELKSACAALIEAAKKEGGDDNITVVLGRFKEAKAGATVRLSDTVRIPPLPGKP